MHLWRRRFEAASTTAPDAMPSATARSDFGACTTVSVPARPFDGFAGRRCAAALATASVDPRRLRDPVSCGCSRRERITNALTVVAGTHTIDSPPVRLSACPCRLWNSESMSNDQVFQYAGSRTTTHSHTPLDRDQGRHMSHRHLNPTCATPPACQFRV